MDMESVKEHIPARQLDPPPTDHTVGTALSSACTPEAIACLGTPPHLDVVNATRRYGRFVALDGIDLTVGRGEIVGILGPNGAGKSTLIRACEGMEALDLGRISVMGRDITLEHSAALGHIGLVLQRPRFSSYATVRETVALFASLHAPRIAPKLLIGSLGLAPKLDMRIAKLSGGERQRLAVLIGLMGAHDLILLDEPTSELDPQARRVVWQLISSVARQYGSAILMTTHQMEEAQMLCDRIYVIDHGRIIASGSPAQVIIETCDELAVCITLGSDAEEELVRHYDDFNPVRHGVLVKCRKSVESAEEGQRLMRSLLDRFGPRVLEVALQRPNLEDVFIRLTGSHLRS